MRLSFKRSFLFVLLSTALIISTLVVNSQKASATDHWQLVGTQDFSSTSVYDVDMVFNPLTKQPYVVYANNDSGALEVKKFNGTSWVDEGTFSTAVDCGNSRPDIDFNPSNGHPYVLCRGANIQVVTYNGSSWSTLESATALGNTNTYLKNSLAIDPVTYEPYVELGALSEVIVKKFNGTVWEAVGSSLGTTGTYAEMKFNPADHLPYVLYIDKGNSDTVTVKKYSGGSWANVTTNGAYPTLLEGNTMFDPDGNLYYVNMDNNRSKKLTVHKFDGASWSTLGTEGFSEIAYQFGGAFSLGYNSFTDTVYLGYITSAYRTKILYFDGSAWQSMGANEWDASDNYAISLAVKPSTGEPFYAYSPDKVSVIGYQLDNPPTTPTPTDTGTATGTSTATPTATGTTTTVSFASLPGTNSLINLEDGQVITTNPFTVRVKPTSAAGIERVEFYIDGIWISTSTTPDSDGVYTFSWDTSKYHSNVKAVAYDNNGQSNEITRATIVDPKLYLATLPATGI